MKSMDKRKRVVYLDDVIETVYQSLRVPSNDPKWVEVVEALGTLPSAQPERKKGKWMAIEYDNNAQPHITEAVPVHEEAIDVSDNPFVHCSVCGKTALFHGWDEKYALSDFCPRCGADMRGGNNEIDRCDRPQKEHSQVASTRSLRKRRT